MWRVVLEDAGRIREGDEPMSDALARACYRVLTSGLSVTEYATMPPEVRDAWQQAVERKEKVATATAAAIAGNLDLFVEVMALLGDTAPKHALDLSRAVTADKYGHDH